VADLRNWESHLALAGPYYGQLMEEVKRRTEVIRIVLQKSQPLPSQARLEICCFQMRRICELIGLACIVVHDNIEDVKSSVTQEPWQPVDVLKRLEEIHSKFFPRPIQEQRAKGGFLTKEDLIALHNECDDDLDRASVRNVFVPTKSGIDFAKILRWTNQIGTLLDQHYIETDDPNWQFQVRMNTPQGVSWGVMKLVGPAPKVTAERPITDANRALLLSPYSADGDSFGILGDLRILQALRPAVLYWDKVAVPIVAPGMLPILEGDVDYLVSAGAVERRNVMSQNSFIADRNTVAFLARDFLQASRHSASIMCPVGDQATLIKFLEIVAGEVGTDQPSKRDVLIMSIRDALPAPPDGVAFQEILEFRIRRADELKRLNQAIDLLAVQLSGADKLEDAVRVARDQVQAALRDIDKVFSEKWPARVLSSIQMNIPSIAGSSLVAAAGTAFELGLNFAIGAAASGAAKPAIQAVFGSFVGRKIPDRAAPFVFAYEAGKELQPR